MEIKKEETWNYLQSTTENSIRFSVSVWLPVSEITTVPVRHAAWGKLGLQDSVMEHNRHNTSITVGTGSKSKLQWCIHSKRHLLLRPLSCLAESWHETSAFYNRSKKNQHEGTPSPGAYWDTQFPAEAATADGVFRSQSILPLHRWPTTGLRISSGLFLFANLEKRFWPWG